MDLRQHANVPQTVLEDALEKYSAKPDCFRRAAAMIRASCAELETREDERVKGIQLTCDDLPQPS